MGNSDLTYHIVMVVCWGGGGGGVDQYLGGGEVGTLGGGSFPCIPSPMMQPCTVPYVSLIMDCL